MNCKEASRMTGDFVEDRLKPADVRKYLRHIDGCEACRSEAETYFLLDRVRLSLDQDPAKANYDFKGAFSRELAAKKHTLHMISFFRLLSIVLLLAAVGVLVWLFFFSGYFK
jgi:hypothetical protein